MHAQQREEARGY